MVPFWLLKRWMRRVAVQGHPLVMYVHPWELDPDQPRMNGPLLSRFRHYVNLHKTEGRLVALLKEFRFAPIREVIGAGLLLERLKAVGSSSDFPSQGTGRNSLSKRRPKGKRATNAGDGR